MSTKSLTAMLISIIIGVITGLLYYMGYLTNIETAIWTIFGLAVFSLIALILSSAFTSYRFDKCLYVAGRYLLTGAIGAIILSIIQLTVTLTVGNIFIAILVGIGGFFASVTILSLAAFIGCLIDFNNRCI